MTRSQLILLIRSSLISCGSASLLALSLLTLYSTWLTARYDKNQEFKAYVESNKHVKQNYKKYGLDERRIKQLLRETWVPKGWKYESRVGFRESQRTGDFVNISNYGYRLNGKKNGTEKHPIEAPKRANTRNIYIFGGSTTFGYGVQDDHTIPAFLESNFDSRISQTRVYNFGRGYYYSLQENDLLENLLRKGLAKPDIAIFIDGLNERCDISTYQQQMSEMFSRTTSRRFEWHPHEFAKPLTYTIQYLRNQTKKNSGVQVSRLNCSFGFQKNPVPLSEVFSQEISRRQQICELHDLQCITFIQPLPGLKNIHNQVEPERAMRYQKKLDMLLAATRNTSHKVIDISDSLSNLKDHAFIDNCHYSPEANELIARKIFSYIPKARLQTEKRL